MTACGLPHSEISGSSLVSSSPELIAACYVLHRLWCQGIHRTLFLLFKDFCPGSAPEQKIEIASPHNGTMRRPHFMFGT